MSTTPPIEPLVSDADLERSATRAAYSETLKRYFPATDPVRLECMKTVRDIYEAERAELIRQRDEAEERTKLVLEQVTIIINAFAAKMKKVNAESGVDFSQLEAIAANPRFTEKAREIAAKALSTLPSPPNR